MTTNELIADMTARIARDFHPLRIILFGSHARGDATADSDVDLLVEFDRPVGLFELFALQDELELILGRHVDVGTVQSLKPRVRERVFEEMVHVL